MVRVWSLYRGGGMGVGHLPEAGGILDQPSIMMDAMRVMEGAAGKLDAEEKRRQERR